MALNGVADLATSPAPLECRGRMCDDHQQQGSVIYSGQSVERERAKIRLGSTDPGVGQAINPAVSEVSIATRCSISR